MRFSKLSETILTACICLFMATACSQANDTTSAESMRLYPLAIHSADTTHIFQVELARTPRETAKGLMFRETLADDAGMLFIMPKNDMVTFWMKNTLIPLDMVFIDTQGMIVHIHPMARPHDESPISSQKPSVAVLEIAGGQAAKRGIHIGDRIETSLLAPTQQ